MQGTVSPHAGFLPCPLWRRLATTRSQRTTACTRQATLLQAGGSLAEVRAVAFPDQGALEGEDLADHPAGLVAVVDDQGVGPDVEREYLEVEVRDEANALGPVLAQGLLATEHAVAADDADRYRRREDDVVGEVLKQGVNVVCVPVLDPLPGERLGFRVIHEAMHACGQSA